MSRRPWAVVLVIAVLLISASLVPRLGGRDLGTTSAAALRTVAAGCVRLAHAAAPPASWVWAATTAALDAAGRSLVAGGRALDRTLAVPGSAARVGPVAEALALALLAGLVALATTRPRRRARATVLRLARAGRATERIARRTGLARDAVRLALRPELATRRRPAESAAPRRRVPSLGGPRRHAPGTGALR